MLIDARNLPNRSTIEADLCIVGAGPAGIALAREFANSSVNVCLLESGGLNFDPDYQELNQGKNTGQPNWPLGVSRIRFFGGTSNLWGGSVIPMNDYELAQRSWVQNLGWPVSSEELRPYLKRALPLFDLDRYDFNAKNWETEGFKTLPFSGDRFTSGVVLHNSPPVRFGIRYHDDVTKPSNIRVYLHANVLDIQTDEHARNVTSLRGTTLEGNRFQVKARTFVLATGGIEVPRLLLLSDTVQKEGLANEHGMVGRYFADHAYFANLGFMVITKPELASSLLPYYGRPTIDGQKFALHLTPSEQVLRREKLLSSRIHFGPATWLKYSPGLNVLNEMYLNIQEGEMPDNFLSNLYRAAADLDNVFKAGYGSATDASVFRIGAWVEPMPRPESRVSLGEERDRLNQRRVVLDWRYGEEEKYSIFRALQILGEELGKAGIGRLRIDKDMDARWPRGEPGLHHMGTTRMHEDPKLGVVDANCRVHGISNLYVASSSVFPTYGHANPTLMILALTLRLSDHLKREVA